MNFVVFVACAIKYFHFSPSDLLDGWRMACLVLGVAMVMLSVWSFKSTYDAVGDFGWYDFAHTRLTTPFSSATSALWNCVAPGQVLRLLRAAYKSSICYTGIYRFLNNPDCVTGYAGQYGLALICQSWVIFILAAFSHVCHIVFLNLVEIPHMHKLYSETELRGEGPLPRALAKVTQTVSKSIVPSPVRVAQKKVNATLRKEVRRIRVAALQEMFELYQRMDALRGQAAATRAARAEGGRREGQGGGRRPRGGPRRRRRRRGG